MTKTVTTIRIDNEVFELAKAKYPNKLSPMIEEYLRGMTEMDLPNIESKNIDEFNELMAKKKEELSRLKLELDTMKQTKKKQEEDLKNQSREKVHKIERFMKGFRASGILRKVK